jgi:hypothetical protein
MQLSLSFLFLVANSLGPFSFANAFSIHHSSVTPGAATITQRSSRLTAPLGMVPRQDDHSFDNHEDDEELSDVEAMRQRLESLHGGDGNTRREMDFRGTTQAPQVPTANRYSLLSHNSPVNDVTLPAANPLTSIDRERRQAEIQMLRQLEYSDESLSDLWTLWFQERGPGAAARLLEAEELTGQGPASWDQAEKVLRSLIEEHGVYWAEPVNRLATLFYMQGKMDESETLCKIVLAVKPWHFGALSGIVMVYAGVHDTQSARQWAARRLPTIAPSGPNRRRAGWVQHAMRDAMESLSAAEMRVMEGFGKPDEHVRRSNKVVNDHDEGDDDWQ